MNEAVNASAQPQRGEQDEVALLKRKLGEQGNELGQLRNALEAKIEEQDRQLVNDSFDSDQVAAMERLVEQKVAPVKQQLNEAHANQATAKLAAKHPDYEAVVNGAEFQSWVQSTKRNAAAFEVAISGDVDVGIELLDAYKAEAQTTPSEEVMNSALASNRGSSGDAGIKESGVILRTEIQQLKRDNPAQYRAQLPKIMAAYQDGRVR